MKSFFGPKKTEDQKDAALILADYRKALKPALPLAGFLEAKNDQGPATESISVVREIAKILIKTKKYRSLHVAAMSGDTKLIEKLLAKKKADINAVDAAGFSPLHYAVAAGNKDAVKLLIKNGANVNLKTTFKPDSAALTSRTPLSRHELLYDTRDHRFHSSRTPIELAVKYNPESISALIYAGAELDCFNTDPTFDIRRRKNPSPEVLNAIKVLEQFFHKPLELTDLEKFSLEASATGINAIITLEDNRIHLNLAKAEVTKYLNNPEKTSHHTTKEFLNQKTFILAKILLATGDNEGFTGLIEKGFQPTSAQADALIKFAKENGDKENITSQLEQAKTQAIALEKAIADAAAKAAAEKEAKNNVDAQQPNKTEIYFAPKELLVIPPFTPKEVGVPDQKTDAALLKTPAVREETILDHQAAHQEEEVTAITTSILKTDGLIAEEQKEPQQSTSRPSFTIENTGLVAATNVQARIEALNERSKNQAPPTPGSNGGRGF